MKRLILSNNRGMAITVVMITLILLSLLAGYSLNLSFNQTRLFQNSAGKRVKVYYAAQAGVVNAFEVASQSHVSSLQVTYPV